MNKFQFQQIGSFFQVKPELPNTYLCDPVLRRFAKRYFPQNTFDSISSDLEKFGQRVSDELDDLHMQCEINPPRHQPFDSWGNRTDELITCEAWKKMKTVTAEEGIVSIAYERKQDTHSRVFQMMKNYLFTSASGLFGCPIAMTDGAAKTIEKMNLRETLGEAYSKLTSRDPNVFWTSGQWMTERGGGSDVANGTETVAIPQDDGTFRLYGYKWFTSAMDSNMALTLARIADNSGNVVEGTRGLSLFYLETLDPDTRKPNGMQVQKLKNKLGTRQLPTAELLLSGTKALRISDPGRGVPEITSMLLICRIHTAFAGISNMRRILMLARDYSTKRKAFGRLIKNHPLHMQTLARMEVDCRAAFLFFMEVSHLLGKDDYNCLTEHEANLLRILSPLLKLFTCKQTMRVVSEGLESFGGQGYIEDTGLPSILRDSQTLPIWEGTTNILSLDLLRCIAKSKGETLTAMCRDVSSRCDQAASRCPNLAPHCEYVVKSIGEVSQFVVANPQLLESAARDLAYCLSRSYMGMLMLEFASFPDSHPSDIAAAERWCNSRNLTSVITRHTEQAYSKSSQSMDYELVMDGYN